MLRKYVGGLTLLVFTFIFITALLVGLHTADAGPTLEIVQPWLTEFFCPDGSYATYSSGEYVTKSYENHPEDRVFWGIVNGGIPGQREVWKEFRVHQKHGKATVTKELDYTCVTVQPDNPVYCQDDGEDEETTN